MQLSQGPKTLLEELIFSFRLSCEFSLVIFLHICLSSPFGSPGMLFDHWCHGSGLLDGKHFVARC